MAKREPNGRYDYDGNLSRLCICGHTLGMHAAGSPADCLVYSFPEFSRERNSEKRPHDCHCEKFKAARKRA